MKIVMHRFTAHRTQGDPGTIDMAADGSFRTAPASPWSARILRYAIVVAVVAAGLAAASLALWFAMVLIPVAIGAALVAYGAFRFRMWRAGRSFGGQRDVFPR